MVLSRSIWWHYLHVWHSPSQICERYEQYQYVMLDQNEICAFASIRKVSRLPVLKVFLRLDYFWWLAWMLIIFLQKKRPTDMLLHFPIPTHLTLVFVCVLGRFIFHCWSMLPVRRYRHRSCSRWIQATGRAQCWNTIPGRSTILARVDTKGHILVCMMCAAEGETAQTRDVCVCV